MREYSSKVARSRLSDLLDLVESGDEITITRRGKTVARLVPNHHKALHLPPLTDFRATIRAKGKPLSQLVRQLREEEKC